MRPVIRNGSCTSNAMISAGSRRQRDVTRQDEGPSGKQLHAPLRMAASWGLYPFLVAEIAKVAAAAGIASAARIIPRSQQS